MEILTAEKIAALTDRFNGIANLAAINRLYRAQDDSSKWPINNKFNVTNRAILRVRKLGMALYGREYCYALEGEMSRIVNQGGI